MDPKDMVSECTDESMMEEGGGNVSIPTHVPHEDARASLKRDGLSPFPDVKWDDVGGLDDIKRELKLRIVLPIRYPNICKDVNMGVLLYGPPGCGKTLIAQAAVYESGANFIHVQARTFLGEDVGSQRAIQTLFERARTSAPCVIFFDDVDGLIGSSSEEEAEGLFRDQFLAELDRRDVHVIAATRKPELIDPLFMQNHRFYKHLYVPLPSPDERAAILRVITRNSPLDPNVALDLIAKKAEGFNGFDLCRLVEKAAEKAEEEAVKGTSLRSLIGPISEE